jgi:hypothetical protein
MQRLVVTFILSRCPRSSPKRTKEEIRRGGLLPPDEVLHRLGESIQSSSHVIRGTWRESPQVHVYTPLVSSPLRSESRARSPIQEEPAARPPPMQASFWQCNDRTRDTVVTLWKRNVGASTNIWGNQHTGA